MEILDYQNEMLEDVVSIYNKAMKDVPNCWPVSETEFSGAVAAVTGGHSDGGPIVNNQFLSVATVAGKIVGFLHGGVDRGKSEKAPPRGAICHLNYDRGFRAAGQMLLEKTEQLFAKESLSDVCAFNADYRYRFYCFPHSYLSDHLDHVNALLQFNNYRTTGGEVFLNGLDYTTTELPNVDLEYELTVSWPQGIGRKSGCIVKAFCDNTEIGQCQIKCGGDFSKHEEAQDYGFVDWLGVEEDFQRCGLGKLLLSKARNEMLDIGYRHTAISTARDNYRAFLFYSNYGYRVVDWTYQLSKSLDGSA